MNIEKMDYCFAVLLIKDRGLTAEAKYFLIRVLFLYEHSFESNCSRTRKANWYVGLSAQKSEGFAVQKKLSGEFARL